MVRATTQFVCQACGSILPKWTGKCEVCQEWNSLVEEEIPIPVPGSGGVRKKIFYKNSSLHFSLLNGRTKILPRYRSQIEEFNRGLGGGFVPGSVILLGGDPGIGKSTLLLQVAAGLAQEKQRVLYISGEESLSQVQLRAQRLKVADSKVEFSSVSDVKKILAALQHEKNVGVVIIDSIQTMWIEGIESVPGTVSQVRASAFELIRTAKEKNFALVLVGHVTKEGALAGPRILEHMVDTVLYFEGERGHQFRILRGAKNRFGATDEIGVFSMESGGLQEVSNPSALFLAERNGNIAGNAVFAGMEGARPVLVEVQALLSPNGGGGRAVRSTTGWDGSRMNMLLAVLENRAGVRLGQTDIYLNIAGGLKITEPAADLAIVAALLSAASQIATDSGAVFFGEIGLSGEIRQVVQTDLRLKEAQKLGFHHAFMPVISSKRPLSKTDTKQSGITSCCIGHITEFKAYLEEKRR